MNVFIKILPVDCPIVTGFISQGDNLWVADALFWIFTCPLGTSYAWIRLVYIAWDDNTKPGVFLSAHYTSKEKEIHFRIRSKRNWFFRAFSASLSIGEF